MNIIRLAFELFIIYILYKLIFGFIIPVYRTTKHMKQKMSEMHQRMQEDETNHQANAGNSSQSSQKVNSDDYIEYEEIK